MNPPTFFGDFTFKEEEHFSIVVVLEAYPTNPPVELMLLIELSIFVTLPDFK